MTLATPIRGRAIPFALVSYSSETIAQQETSRNLYHHQAFAMSRALMGDKPLVVDREFSYLELLLNLVVGKVHFVIRLNLGSQPPTFLDEEGRRVDLSLSREEERVIPHVFYKGQVLVNPIGRWGRGFSQPLWVTTDLEPQTAVGVYLARVKIEASTRFRKEHLMWTIPQLHTLETGNRWSVLVSLAMWELYLAWAVVTD